MFTGIVQDVGEIYHVQPRDGDMRVQIETRGLDLSDVALGDSIAVNGVCLTVVERMECGFAADLSRETLSLTSLSTMGKGTRVNLEKALTPATRLGGHLVSGHVDGLGKVQSRSGDARSVRFRIEAPRELARYIAKKGSICIDGTSLTVNDVSGAEFEVNIVPHTMTQTIIGDYQPGTQVNLEVDLIARYLERLLLGDRAADPQAARGVDLSLLRKRGFVD